MNLLASMKIFVKVTETNSFSRAALSLKLPKASVTTAIQHLEAKLKMRLLFRTTRTVHLTQEGTAFLERCQELISEFNDLETMFLLADTVVEGKIQVGVCDLISNTLLVPALSDFLDLHSAVQLEFWKTRGSINLADNFDCWMTLAESPDPQIVSRGLGHLKFINCVSPLYIERFGIPSSLKDLNHHHLIVGTAASDGSESKFTYLEGELVEYEQTLRALTIESLEGQVAGAVAGLGIIQVPRILVEQKIKDSLLVEVLPEYQKRPLQIHLTLPQHRRVSRKVQVFIKWCEGLIDLSDERNFCK